MLIPKENEKDLWDLPDKIKKGIEIVPVSRIEEVLKRALLNDPEEFVPANEWKAGAKSPDNSADKTAGQDAGAQ